MRVSFLTCEDMAKTPMYTLKFSKSEGCWNMHDMKGREVACYMSKAEAMKSRALRKVVGKAGGVVKIMSKAGKKVGQRSYPKR